MLHVLCLSAKAAYSELDYPRMWSNDKISKDGHMMREEQFWDTWDCAPSVKWIKCRIFFLALPFSSKETWSHRCRTVFNIRRALFTCHTCAGLASHTIPFWCWRNRFFSSMLILMSVLMRHCGRFASGASCETVVVLEPNTDTHKDNMRYQYCIHKIWLLGHCLKSLLPLAAPCPFPCQKHTQHNSLFTKKKNGWTENFQPTFPPLYLCRVLI